MKLSKRGKILLFAGIVLISVSLLLVRMEHWSQDNKKHIAASREIIRVQQNKKDDLFSRIMDSMGCLPAFSEDQWSMSTFDDTADGVLKSFKILAWNKYDSGIYDDAFNPADSMHRGQKVSNDSVYIIVSPGKPLTFPLYFKVLENNHPLNERTRLDLGASNKLGSNFYKIATLPRSGHSYKIIFSKNRESEPYAMYQAEFRRRPQLLGIYFPEYEDALNDALLKIDHSNYYDTLLPKVDWKKYQPEAHLRLIRFDSVHKMMEPYPSDGLYVYSRYNTILFLYTGMGDSTALEYQLTPESIEADTLKTWKHTLPGNYLIKLTGIEPGEYRLKVRYNRYNSKINSYSVIIRPMWYETPWINWSKGFVLGFSMIVLPFLLYKRSQKAKLRKKEQERTMLDLQMKSYRAQLNPHFIFNALTSIQSLINKQDTAAANRYLGEFSQLLRKTLDEQVTTFWTLQDELDLLQQYIGLEQLRFGIQYELQMDAGIHAAQITFPSMLLQPVVENAVRHGISGKAADGQITVRVSGTDDRFTITITDNGHGFDTGRPMTGNHGLRLTQERIELSNTHHNGHITFSIASEDGKTTATFYFEHL